MSYKKVLLLLDPHLAEKFEKVPSRVEICRDRRDQRLCKIFVNCVNFSRKKRIFSHILCRRIRIDYLFCKFTHTMQTFFITVQEFTHFVQFYPKKDQIIDIDAFTLAKIVAINAFQVCKILLPENWVV